MMTAEAKENIITWEVHLSPICCLERNIDELQGLGGGTEGQRNNLKDCEMPEGHRAMDKALACQAGGLGSNPDTTKEFSAPILLGTPITCTLSLSHNASHHVFQC